jgi:hypothetical protein
MNGYERRPPVLDMRRRLAATRASGKRRTGRQNRGEGRRDRRQTDILSTMENGDARATDEGAARPLSASRTGNRREAAA